QGEQIFGMAVSPDSRRLALAVVEGVRLRDPISGDETARVGGGLWRADHTGQVAFLADGTLCLGGDDGTLRFWPAAEIKGSIRLDALPAFRPLRAQILRLLPVPGQRAVLCVGADGSLCLWDVERGKPAGSWQLQEKEL